MTQLLFKIKGILQAYSLAILAGIFIGTSYIPLPPWAQLFGFVPLWWAWYRSTNYRSIFWQGWVAQWVFTFIGFNWIAHTVHEFGGFPWSISLVVLGLFCGIANLDVPLAGLFWFFLSRKFPTSPKMSLFRLAIITALFEAWVPTLFPWNYGYPWLWVNWPIAQLSELIGFQGLSALIILLNLGFYIAFQNWRQSHNHKSFALCLRKIRPALASLVIFIMMNIIGWVLLWSSNKPDREVTVTLTQANIGNQMKIAAEQGWGFRDYIVEKYLSITQKSFEAQPSQLILWPETAIPFEFNFDNGFSEVIHSLEAQSKEWGAFLFTGGYGYSDRDARVTNSLFVIDPQAGVQREHYFKTHLLAFGEYIPGGEIFPQLYKYIPAGHFRKGQGPKVLSLKLGEEELKFGPQICYESLFPDFSRKLSDLGAEVIVNATNDSWYGTWQEPFQHLYMTAGRAVEFRRPLIRVTNTGISAVVLASGEVLNPSPMNVEWAGFYNVPYKNNPAKTIYQQWPWLMDIVLMLALILSLWKKQQV